jgi:hypothetical protein
MLADAVARLAAKAQAGLAGPLSAGQWAVLGGVVAIMAYAEGYRGFQRAFAPLVVVRARWLRDHPRLDRVALAPLFCMGLVGATGRRLLRSWGVVAMVVGFVLAMRLLPQPWRSMVDAGVVVGLGWGSLAIVGWAVAAGLGRPLPVRAAIAGRATDVAGDEIA